MDPVVKKIGCEVVSFGFSTVSGVANFCKEATAVASMVTGAVIAHDLFLNNTSPWNRLNPCNKNLPTSVNIAMAIEGFGNLRARDCNFFQHQDFSKTVTFWTNNQALFLPFLAIGAPLAHYAFSKIETATRDLAAQISRAGRTNSF